MKIVSSLILVVSLIGFFVVGITPSFAVCDADTTSSAASFLVDCAGSATNAVSPSAFTGGKNGTKELVINVAEKAMQFGALFAIGAIVFAGIRYIASAGDDEKLKSAKNTGIYALIGLILILTAFPFVDLIINFFYSLG